MNTRIKKIVEFVLLFCPSFIKEYAHSIGEKEELNEAVKRMRRTKVSKEDVISVLNSFDLNSDVMLHCSIMNIGKIAGGTKFLCNAILEKVDISKHTLLVSALPYRGAFKDYLDKNPVFNVNKAPIEMGAVNEYLGMMDCACRSLHPTHSVVALGPNAKEYTAKHHLDKTPFGVNSPYYKLIMNHGKILLFGASLNNLTIVHVIEDMIGNNFPVRVYYPKVYSVKVIDWNNKECIVNTTCHNKFYGILRDCNRLKDGMTENNIMEVKKIGEADVCVIKTWEFAVFYLNMILNGKSIYGFHRVSDKLRMSVENTLKILYNTNTNN